MLISASKAVVELAGKAPVVVPCNGLGDQGRKQANAVVGKFDAFEIGHSPKCGVKA